MEFGGMHLEILYPGGVYCDEVGVKRIVVKSLSGSFCILPHRLDCVAVLLPGTLVFENSAQQIKYVHVGQGILTKVKGDVVISVRSAEDVSALEVHNGKRTA